MNKIVALLIPLISIIFVFSVIAQENQSASVPPDTGSGVSAQHTKQKSDSSAQLSLTLEELTQYNGTNGKPAYVAVDGIIYDVSPIKAWKKGKHKGRHKAGAELGEEIKKQSPHGLKVLKRLKIVGKVVPASD